MKIKYHSKKSKIRTLINNLDSEKLLHDIGVGLGLAGMVIVTATTVYDTIKDKDSEYNKRKNERTIQVKENDLEKSCIKYNSLK